MSYFCHVVSGHIDVHPNIKWLNFISYLKTLIFDKTVNYIIFQKRDFGMENLNCPYFARIYVYMSRVCIEKSGIIASFVFLKIAVKFVQATPN